MTELAVFIIINSVKSNRRPLLPSSGINVIPLPLGLVKKFTDDEEYLQKELKNALSRVQCLELIPEHMTGKLVNES